MKSFSVGLTMQIPTRFIKRHVHQSQLRIWLLSVKGLKKVLAWAMDEWFRLLVM